MNRPFSTYAQAIGRDNRQIQIGIRSQILGNRRQLVNFLKAETCIEMPME